MKDARAIGEQRESPLLGGSEPSATGERLALSESGSGAGRLGLPVTSWATCLTVEEVYPQDSFPSRCSHARLSSKSGEPPRSCDPWRRHVDAALAEHIFGRGRARGRAGASAGTAVRAKRLRGERPALDSAE